MAVRISVTKRDCPSQHSTANNAFLCTASHDIQDPHMRLIRAPIEIGGQA